MLAYIIGVVLFALGIFVSVALHEAGHLIAAKSFGMKVRRYFIGFGPTIFSFRRGGTEYGAKWIPLGGLCDIAGMTNLDEVTPDEAPRAMWRYKTWKRTIVLVAGSFTHFILGFVVLYLMAVTMGLPNLMNKPVLEGVSDCVASASTREEFNNHVCQPGDPAPAKQAGLRAGDQVVAVGGQATPKWTDVLDKVQAAQGPTQVQVLREGQRMTYEVNIPMLSRPDASGKVQQVGTMGASRQSMFQYSAVSAVPATTTFTGEMFSQTWQRLLELPQRIPAVVHSIFGGERDPNTPISVVGASRIGGEAVQQGFWELFFFLLASFNFFIGVFNLLPLLPLDGGHVAVTWYERIRDWLRKMRGKVAGGPVDYTKLSAVTMVLVVIGGGVVLLTVTADIVNPVTILN